MFMRDDVTYEFHHIGVPTSEVREGEHYCPQYRMYTSDRECKLAHIQYQRFEAGSPLHELMRRVPHVAFMVDDLDKAIDGKEVVLGPYEPIDGFRVAVVIDDGVPVELIQTVLDDEDIWSRTVTGRHARLYAAHYEA